MDFRSYKNSYHKKTSDSFTGTPKDIRKTAEEYAQMSDNDLLSEIKKAAADGKKNGTFSEEQLRQFVSAVSPMMNEEQKSRLNSVIRMLGND